MLLNDGVRNNPKVRRAGAEAAWLWACAIDYCREQLTDGFLEIAMLGTLGNFKTNVRTLAARCVDAGLFDLVEGSGWRVHDFLLHNNSRAQVEEIKRRAKEKKSDQRKGERRLSLGDTPTLSLGDTGRCPSETEPSVPETRLRRDETETRRGEVKVFQGVEPEKGGCMTGAEFWDLWLELGSRRGAKQPLMASPNEFEHIRVLCESYGTGDLVAAMSLWWCSPHTNGRNVGLFRSQIGEVLEHITHNGLGTVFRAPKPRIEATKQGVDVAAWAASAKGMPR